MRYVIPLLLVATLFAAPARALSLLDGFAGTSLSSNWTPQSGSWSVSNGTLDQTTSAAFSSNSLLQWDTPSGASSYSIQVDVGLPSGVTNQGNNAVGIAFRIQDANDYYRIHIFPGFPGSALRFEKIVNGSLTDMTGDINVGFTAAVGSFYTLRVDVSGTSYTASIMNGIGDTGFTYTQTFTDATFLTGGAVGLVNAGGPGMFQRFEGDASFGATAPEPASFAIGLAGLLLLARGRRRPVT